MAYHLRIILDAKEDIFKDLVVNEEKSLFDLHEFIKSSFNLPGNELASYYTATQDWEQNEEEIPLENFSEDQDLATMHDFQIKQILPTTDDKLIYVYDLFSLWTFFVEVVKITDEIKKGMEVNFSFGEMPKEAPEKLMNQGNGQNNAPYEEEDFFDQDNDDFDSEELEGLSEFDMDEDYR